MKYYILTLLFVFSPFSTCRAIPTVVVNHEKIEKIPFKIEPNGFFLKIIFADNSYVITRMDETVIMMEEGADNKGVKLPDFYYIRSEVDGHLNIDGINPGDNLSLYSANGNLIRTFRSFGTSISLNLSGNKNGLYLIRINSDIVIKFLKK